MRDVEPARNAVVDDHRAVVVAQAALVVTDAGRHMASSDFVRHRIPALALTDLRAQPPAPRLLAALDALPHGVDALAHDLLVGGIEADVPQPRADALEVDLGRSPQPPVLRGESGYD